MLKTKIDLLLELIKYVLYIEYSTKFYIHELFDQEPS